MKLVDEKSCLDLILTQFPELKPDWEIYRRKYEVNDINLEKNFSFLKDYIIETLDKNNDRKLKQLLDLVEYLLKNGKEEIKKIAKHQILELIKRSEIDYSINYFVDFLGDESLAFYKQVKHD